MRYTGIARLIRPIFLRENLHNLIKNEESCFDFYLLEQGDPCKNDMEIHSKPWVGEWVKVAQIHYPKQEFLFEDQLKFCEDLHFNPWHTLEDHRPLSSIGEARKFAYSASQTDRQALNKAPYIEPTGQETFNGNIIPAK